MDERSESVDKSDFFKALTRSLYSVLLRCDRSHKSCYNKKYIFIIPITNICENNEFHKPIATGMIFPEQPEILALKEKFYKRRPIVKPHTS